MPRSFGQENPALTAAIRKLARVSSNVEFTTHALEEAEQDGFDSDDILTCLRKGTAYGPELQKGKVRANMIYRGLKIRVAVGGLDEAQDDWRELARVVAVTAMKDD